MTLEDANHMLPAGFSNCCSVRYRKQHDHASYCKASEEGREGLAVTS